VTAAPGPRYPAPPSGALLTIAEVAQVLGRSEDFVRNLIADGELPARKIRARWYVGRPDLEAWLAPTGAKVRPVVPPSGYVLPVRRRATK